MSAPKTTIDVDYLCRVMSVAAAAARLIRHDDDFLVKSGEDGWWATSVTDLAHTCRRDIESLRAKVQELEAWGGDS